MSDLKVTDVTVPDLLGKLRRGEWLVPEFQRDFVWTTSNVCELVVSVFERRPIGMATIWEQPDKSALPLEPISIPDHPDKTNGSGIRFFTDSKPRPSKVFAILDGKQRCTALAIAFGGLRPLHTSLRSAGRYFLNVATDDPAQRVLFIRDRDLKRRNLESEAACIAAGYFPLCSHTPGEEFLSQWMRYLQAIRNSQIYPGAVLPDATELERRDKILKESFEGIVGTKLAVYVVPDTYNLADICDIFEKLNTTGTPVSTVDLIHSWLYSDTATSAPAPLLLRDWMDDLGELDGGAGWSSSKVRPELIAQIVTACYLALDVRPPARGVSGVAPTQISSVKSADLLATPTAHWQSVVANTGLLAEFLGDFQRQVADGLFGYDDCPYPVSAAIYVGLRWHAHFDGSTTRPWSQTDLNALYRAFYWRNALTNRYDQGFLTKMGTDLKGLKSILEQRGNYSSGAAWTVFAESQLSTIIDSPIPTREALVEDLTDGRRQGAAHRTFTLLMIARSTIDMLDSSISLRHPSAEPVELHHIYPKSWCNSSKSGTLAMWLDRDKAGRDYINSIANLMPLSRRSNNDWKKKLPGQVFVERGIVYAALRKALEPQFIDEECFNLLWDGANGIPEFWNKRAALIASELVRRTQITL